ncbi:MAG: cell wall hydrolase [Holosporaceae bacterium]|jgi:spore germination cell wall hydrolase CwlJ-like protein|nr:cell wall hydrolase [Holosporaceae bacterium]
MNFLFEDLDVLSRTIYGETRGDLYRFGVASLIAVANVVANRKNKNFAKTIRDVCLAPHQFSCWNKNDANYEKIKNITTDCAVFRKCQEIAENVLLEKWPDLTDGCDHYHHRNIKPYWAAYFEPKRAFGSHYFYNLRNK